MISRRHPVCIMQNAMTRDVFRIQNAKGDIARMSPFALQPALLLSIY
jgi:hypothetical protein